MNGQFFPALRAGEMDDSESRLTLCVAGALAAGFVVATVLGFGRGHEPAPAAARRQPPVLEQREAAAPATTNSLPASAAISDDKRG